MTSRRQRLLDQAHSVARQAKGALPHSAQAKVSSAQAKAVGFQAKIRPAVGQPLAGVTERLVPTDPEALAIKLITGSDKNHRYDIQTAAIIAKVMGPDDLGIDIGCHQGAILDHMIKAAPEVRHLAFEPLPHLADALRSKYDGVELHQLALMAKPSGNIEFHHVVSNPGYSGILERRYDRPDEEIDLISVATAKLDDLVPTSLTPVIIKIDVEGAELGVLQGGRETIVRAKPLVVFENGLGASDHYGTTPGDIYDFFESCGMRLSLLGTWLEDGPSLSKDQHREQFEQGHNYYFIGHS